MIYVYIFTFIGVFVLALTALVYRLTSRWGRLRAVTSTLFALVLLVLCWPIPGHGVFTFLGEILFAELSSMWDERREERAAEAHSDFITGQSERFAGRLAELF